MAYRTPDDRRALFQLLNTGLPFLLCCAALLWLAAHEHWLPLLLLAVPTSGLLVRLFTIQHDCGHGSFLTSRSANTLVGRALSLFTLTPYDSWRRAHTLHHSSAGDLSRRGIGDVDTWTLREYRASSSAQRLKYRLYRNPLILHLIGPPLYFILLQRSPIGQSLPAREVWRSILGLDAALVVFYGAIALAVGLETALWALLPVACLAAWLGGWLFFVQHQFEHTHWDDAEDWNLQVAALNGSSYYVMPAILHWFTGNIGLHHIHHLNSRIPNYRLQECLAGDAALGTFSRLSLRDSLACIGLALWDEDRQRLISFAEAEALR